jgi:hypothetical protein
MGHCVYSAWAIELIGNSLLKTLAIELIGKPNCQPIMLNGQHLIPQNTIFTNHYCLVVKKKFKTQFPTPQNAVFIAQNRCFHRPKTLFSSPQNAVFIAQTAIFNGGKNA